MSSRRLLHVLSRPWAAVSRASKTTTGLVGVPVIPDSVAVLQTASTRVLAAVAKHVPATAHYRRQVEAIYQGRLEACKAHGTAEGVEAALGEGQIEELIRMAKEEEALIPQMGEWKPWEVPEGHSIPVERSDRKALPPAPKY